MRRVLENHPSAAGRGACPDRRPRSIRHAVRAGARTGRAYAGRRRAQATPDARDHPAGDVQHARGRSDSRRAPGLPAGQPLERGHFEAAGRTPTRRSWSPRSGRRRTWPTTWTWGSSWCRRIRSGWRSRSPAIPRNPTPGPFRSRTTRRSRVGRSTASSLEHYPAPG